MEQCELLNALNRAAEKVNFVHFRLLPCGILRPNILEDPLSLHSRDRVWCLGVWCSMVSSPRHHYRRCMIGKYRNTDTIQKGGEKGQCPKGMQKIGTDHGQLAECSKYSNIQIYS